MLAHHDLLDSPEVHTLVSGHCCIAWAASFAISGPAVPPWFMFPCDPSAMKHLAHLYNSRQQRQGSPSLGWHKSRWQSADSRQGLGLRRIPWFPSRPCHEQRSVSRLCSQYFQRHRCCRLISVNHVPVEIRTGVWQKNIPEDPPPRPGKLN